MPSGVYDRNPHREPPEPDRPSLLLFKQRCQSAHEMLLEGFSHAQVIAIHGSIVLRYVVDNWHNKIWLS